MPKDESKVSKKRAEAPASEAHAGDEPENEPTFEAALQELENVVVTLENGGVPLETSLQMLKRGLELADRCERVLSEAELTLQKLVLTDEGELLAEDVVEE